MTKGIRHPALTVCWLLLLVLIWSLGLRYNTELGLIGLYFFSGLVFTIATNSLFISWGVLASLVTFITSLIMITKLSQYLSFVLAVTFFFILLGALALLLIKRLKSQLTRNHMMEKLSKQVNYLTNTKLFFNTQIMKQSGLNEQERNFIKKDLNKRYENYRYLQRQPMEITVPNYQQTLRLIQSIFREITDNPRTMLSMSDFLYQHLEEYTKIVHNIRDLQDNPLQTEQDQHLISLGFDRLIEMEKDFQQDFIQVTQDERDSLQNL